MLRPISLFTVGIVAEDAEPTVESTAVLSSPGIASVDQPYIPFPQVGSIVVIPIIQWHVPSLACTVNLSF